MSYEPSFTVAEDTEIVLDENQTGRFGYRVDRPVVDDGAILDVGWGEGSDYTAFTFFGAVDRLYARPSAGLPGQMTVAANWLLSQPEGLLTPRTAKPVALRPLTPVGGNPARTPVRQVDGSFRVVDAGAAASPRTTSVRGAVALVAGTCADLTDAATALKKAGARAMVAYAAPGQACAGHPGRGRRDPGPAGRSARHRGAARRRGPDRRPGHPPLARLHVRPGALLG